MPKKYCRIASTGKKNRLTCPLLKELLTPNALTVLAFLALHAARAITFHVLSALPLCNDALKIPGTNQTKKRSSPRPTTGYDPSQRSLVIHERPFPQIFAVEPEQIEGVKAGIASSVHQPVELRVSGLVETHNFAVENCIRHLEIRPDRLAECAKALVDVVGS
jgi:hypothetical protein